MTMAARGNRMTCRVLLAMAMAYACQLSANAADVLPAYLVGTWGTAASLYEGTTGQSQMHLQADGFGVMVGSTPPAIRQDDVDDGKPAPRAIIGFPVRATVDGDVLTAQPFLRTPHAGQGTAPPIICHHEAAGPTLTCTGPDKMPMAMQRHSATVPAEIAAMIDGIRQQTGH